MSINQNQIRDLSIATATAAASVGRPNEIAHIVSLGGFFKYVIDSTLTNNATTVVAANGTNAHWVMIANYTSGVKNNFAATSAPNATNDSSTTQGYSAGSVWVDVTNDKTYVCVDSTVNAAIWNPYSDATRLTEAITQAAHGFTMLDAVRFDGTNWVKAVADTTGASAAQAIVSNLFSASKFEITTKGPITVATHGLTVANYYWLDQTTAGASTSVAPTSGTAQALMFVRDANTIFVNIGQPAVIGGGGATPAKEFIEMKPVPTQPTVTAAVGVASGLWQVVTTNGMPATVTSALSQKPSFTLKAGKKYRLTAQMYTSGYTTATQYMAYQWYVPTLTGADAFLGLQGMCNQSGTTTSNRVSQGTTAIAYFAPTVDTNVYLRISATYAGITMRPDGTRAIVEEI